MGERQSPPGTDPYPPASLPYCLAARLPYCLIALLPHCLPALTPRPLPPPGAEDRKPRAESPIPVQKVTE